MIIIFEHRWSIPYEADGTVTIPIEYESVIKFQCDVLDAIKEARKTEFGTIHIAGVEFCNYQLDEIEQDIQRYVYTLEEWVSKHKSDPGIKVIP